jgi:hypothetical protein
MALLRWAAFAAALWLAIEFLQLARLRLPEPYALRWLETYLFRSAYEAYRGGPLFAAPTISYIAPIYQPLYFILGGWGFHLFGPGFTALRGISMMGFAGCMIVVLVWLRRAGHGWPVAAALTGLLLLVPHALNDWMTTANLDAPFFFFVLLGLLFVRFDAHRHRATALAAVAMALGFAIKQQALPFAVATGLALAFGSPRRGWTFGLSFLGLAGGWVLAWHLASGGWSTRIAIELPLRSIPNPDFDLADWLFARLPSGGLAFALGLAGVLVAGGRRLWTFWACLAAATIGMTWLSGRKDGGTINNLLPYLTIAFLVAAEAWLMVCRRWPRTRWAAPVLLVAVTALLSGEAWRTHGMNASLRAAHAAAPGASAYRQIEAFEHRLADVVSRYDGPVFVGGRFRTLVSLGRPVENFHQTALFEGTVRARLYDVEAIAGEALRTHRFDALIVWHRDREVALRQRIEQSYVLRGSLGTDPLIGLEVEIFEPRAPDPDHGPSSTSPP